MMYCVLHIAYGVSDNSSFHFFFYGIWSQISYAICHLRDRFGKSRAHCRRHMEHFDSFAANADLVQQLFEIFDTSFSVGITFQVMTRAFQSAGNHNAIRTVLERLEHVQHIEFAGARQEDDADIRRVLDA